MTSLLSLLFVFVGLFFFVSLSLWLWFIIYRPMEWEQFIEEKRDIWFQRGESIGWAGEIKDNKRRRGLQVALGIGIVMAGILTLVFVIFLIREFPFSD